MKKKYLVTFSVEVEAENTLSAREQAWELVVNSSDAVDVVSVEVPRVSIRRKRPRSRVRK